ncbi:MAG: hypothetical protein KDB53_20555, partial [Planctomycetes bacterium]|nr:hypothetical protein [Planctomycetota bacterium]
ARWNPGLPPWRPSRTLYYMSHTPIDAQLLVDISEVMTEKEAAARCYRSQFHDAASREPQTFISRPDFWDWWKGRASWWGHFIGVRHAEAYFVDGPVPTRDPVALFDGFGKYRNT